MSEILIYVTCANMTQAETLARNLLEQRLCACVNLLPGMRSLYWWKDRVEESSEVVLIAKTRAAMLEPFTQAVKSMHLYEVPCVVALPIIGGNPDFLQWIQDETV